MTYAAQNISARDSVTLLIDSTLQVSQEVFGADETGD
jgi:hypothetical protein